MKDEVLAILNKYVAANKGNEFEHIIIQLANEVKAAMND